MALTRGFGRINFGFNRMNFFGGSSVKFQEDSTQIEEGLYDDVPWKAAAEIAAENAAGELPVNQSAYGKTVPVFRGAVLLKGMPIWARKPTKTFVSSGGKGGQRTTTPRYTANFAMGFGDNAFSKPSKLLRVWADDKVVYDTTTGAQIDVDGTIRFYDGTQTTADPFITDQEDDGALTPAFLDQVYIVFENFNVENYGIRIPVIKAEFGDDTTLTAVDTAIVSSPTIDTGLFYVDGGIEGCFDWSDGLIYSFYYSQTDASERYLVTYSIDSKTEMSRVRINSSLYNYFGYALAIEGTQYIIAGATLVASPNNDQQVLIDTQTGEIVASLANKLDGEGGAGPDLNRVTWNFIAPLLGTNQKHIAVGTLQYDFSGGTELTGFGVVVMEIDLENFTLSYRAYGDTNTTARAGYDAIVDVAKGYVGVGYFTSYVVYENSIWEMSVNADTISWTQILASPGYSIVVAYCRDDDTLIYNNRTASDGGPWLRKIELDGTVVWTVTDNGDDDSPIAITTLMYLRNGPTTVRNSYSTLSGYVFFITTSKVYLVKCSDGSFRQFGAVNIQDGWDVGVSQSYGSYYRNNADYPDWTEHRVATNIPNEITVSSIITDLVEYQGLATPTVVGVTDTVYGILIRENVSLSELIRNITTVYRISAVESDGLWKFRAKELDGSFAVDVTLAANDLVEMSDGDAVRTVWSTRKHELDVPNEMQLDYLDYDAEYNIGSQSHKRPGGLFQATSSTRKEIVSIPLISTADKAKPLVMDMLYDNVASMQRRSVEVGAEFAYLEPGDVVQFPASDTVTSVARVLRSTLREDYTTELELEETISAAVSTKTGSAAVLTPAAAVVAAASRYIHLDLPLLRFDHDTVGASLCQYSAVTGRGQSDWPGARMWHSRSVSDFVWVYETIGGVDPIVGAAVNALGAPEVNWATDRKNSLELRIVAGDKTLVVSDVHLDVLNGSNVAALGVSGRYEIIQWEDVVDNGDTITLTNLQRGLLGTEVYQDQHAIGDVFVVLDGDSVKKFYYETSQLNVTWFFKAVGAGRTQEQTAVTSGSIAGAAETPYAPAFLDAVWNGADIDIDWTRRTRLSANLLSLIDNGTTAPLGETTEEYEVDIYDSPGGSVLRTLTVTSEAATYTEAQQQADMTASPPLEALTFAVYQKSALVGRGHEALATVEL